jgi:protein O-GlcNAc transferase
MNFTESFLKQRKLRIGYVSSDIFNQNHPVSRFFQVILDHSVNMDNYYYIEGSIDVERSNVRIITGLSDASFHQLVAKDEIDVLVDLNGYTGGNRLQAFQTCPNVKKITFLGCPLPIKDRPDIKHISDAFCEGSYIGFNKIIMKNSFLHFTIPKFTFDSPKRIQSPVLRLGCFNKLAKINKDVISF